MPHDLPPYAVRESTRARHVRLTVSARDGLVVVVPRRFPASRIPAIVATRRVWAERALARVAERREAFLAGAGELPQRVELPGIGESWEVVYRPSEGEGVRASVSQGTTLTLSGAVDDIAACHAALCRFVHRRASNAFGPALEALSAECGLPFARLSVRNQRSRWGSCSAVGSISLNASLAFLPPRLTRHVMLHELAHTRRLDHSATFHAILKSLEPDAPRLARELREGWRHVPVWASSDG
jgi:predicted metal-dependent hydrolase